MKTQESVITVAGEKLTLQTGKLAPSADFSVYACMGETCVLTTLVIGQERSDIDYFPLYIEYIEKLYAGGKIKGSRWVKREGRPSEEAVLIRRLIDRGIRPLFPKGFKKEVQIVITLLSVDGKNSPEIVSAIAASAVLSASNLPFNGPISTLRIGYVDTKDKKEKNFVINPTEEIQDYSDLDLIVTSTKDRAVMIETQAKQVDDNIILSAIELALKENAKIISSLDEFAKKADNKKEIVVVNDQIEKICNLINKSYKQEMKCIVASFVSHNNTEKTFIKDLVDAIYDSHKDEFDRVSIHAAIIKTGHKQIRDNIIKNKKRIDGRKLDEIRQLVIETSVLPRTHGSALFQRGATQVLSIATLGAPTLEQLIEGPEGNEAKKYMHHYFMPPYSVGEVGRFMFTAPREIGHGALAEKAIEPVLPSDEEFPYVIRVVSEVLSSNGSTSMAATCGSTLSLMDAGVPIKTAIAGISVGLVWESDKKYELLTDIAGIEDFAGDMDFKIAGSVDGITAIQLDVKINGITLQIIKEAFKRAKIGRLYILEQMKKVISSSRKDLSKYAPRVEILTPPEDKIGEIIGPGGKNIRQIIAKTETDISITDDGKVSVSGLDKEKVSKAIEIIKNIYRTIQVGERFEGEVKRILPFGVFVEFLPGKEGFIHISKLSKNFVKDPHDIVHVGQKLKVKVFEIDNLNRINLSIDLEQDKK